MKLQSIYLTATIHVNVIWHEILIDTMPIRLKAKLTDKPLFGDLPHIGTQVCRTREQCFNEVLEASQPLGLQYFCWQFVKCLLPIGKTFI